MTRWNPSLVREKAGLFLSDTEKTVIRAKLPVTEGHYMADAVFEGGGVKGIAFLGALRCFSDVGVRWQRSAGTSAGAITAALVAADFTIQELEAIFGALDFDAEFLAQKTSPLIFNRTPGDDLSNPQWMVPNLMAVGQLGQYSTDPFKRWLEGVLGDRLRTFADIDRRHGRDLRVIVSDISRGQMLVLPDDLDKIEPPLANKQAFEVAEAVRLSMSIPLFFEPGILGTSTIVDGGILSNFPLWLFDIATMRHLPRWPTFGFRLTGQEDNRTIRSAVDVFTGMFQTMMTAGDRYHLRRNGQGRVIYMNTDGIEATQFNLSNADKDDLYRIGYEAAQQFLLEEWDWRQHLRLRGYSPDQLRHLGPEEGA